MKRNYEVARARNGIVIDKPARAVILANGRGTAEVSSLHTAETVRRVDAHARSLVADCEVWAEARNARLKIHVRHDWTSRTETARASRSTGGLLTEWFAAFDAEEDEREQMDGGDRIARVPAVSLRLCRYAGTGGSTYWKEYDGLHYSPKVGSRDDITAEQKLAFLVAHECAHAIHHARVLPLADLEEAVEDYGDNFLVSEKARAAHGYNGPHELYWQAIYFGLRNQLGLNSVGTVPQKEPELVAMLTPVKRRTAKQHELLRSVLPKCPVCGSPVEQKRSFKNAGRKRKFCSTVCRKKAHRVEVKTKAKAKAKAKVLASPAL